MELFVSLFGNNTAEKCLLYIQNYGNGYINGIARTFGLSPRQVQMQLDRLERDEILISRFTGNIKLFTFNPECVYIQQLCNLLEHILSSLDQEVTKQFFRERRRPSSGRNTRQQQRRKRLVVFERDRGKCALCGLTKAFWEVDHQIPLCEGGSDDYRNLRTLCKECHRKETNKLMGRLGTLRKHVKLNMGTSILQCEP